MTVTYRGVGEYNLYFSDKMIVMSESEMTEIANYAVESNFEVGINEKLSLDNEILEEQIEELQESLSDWKFSYKRMYEQLEQILNEHKE